MSLGTRVTWELPGRNKRHWLFFCPSFNVYLAPKGNTPQNMFLKHFSELGGFKCHWKERGLPLVSYTEPENGPGWPNSWARPGATQEVTEEAARETGHGPKGQPLCLTLWLGIWRKGVYSSQISPLNSFVVDPAGLLFSFF